MSEKAKDEYSAEETERRVKAAVQGAFSGPPKPLKDIPKKNGESRKTRKTDSTAVPQSKRKQKV